MRTGSHQQPLRLTLATASVVAATAVLFGQQLNSEIERGRELSAGLPAERDIQLPLRDEPKKDKEADAERVSAEAREKMERKGELQGESETTRFDRERSSSDR